MSSDLGWRADGIARAQAAGGLLLDVYRRPGFAGGTAVRVIGEQLAGGGGFDAEWTDPEPDELRAPRVTHVRRPGTRWAP